MEWILIFNQGFCSKWQNNGLFSVFHWNRPPRVGFGASVNPSVFHLPSSVMHYLIPSVRSPKEILCCFQIGYDFPTHESQGKWKWSDWAMYPHLQGNEREISLQRYWNYYMNSQNAFYEPRMKIKSPEKPQIWRTPIGIVVMLPMAEIFPFISTPIINNMYII